MTLGTPPHTYLLASAQNQNDSYKVVPEEIEFMFDGSAAPSTPMCAQTSPTSRRPPAEPYSRHPRSPGRAALSHSGYDNNVSRITANVLDRFIDADG